MFESVYKTLRIGREAGPEEARRAYVRLVRRYPPEHFPAKFAAIHDAYRQLTLDDDFVKDFAGRINSARSLLEFAGLLWGDLEELNPPAFDLNELAPLVKAGEREAELDDLLAAVDTATIEWRDAK